MDGRPIFAHTYASASVRHCSACSRMAVSVDTNAAEALQIAFSSVGSTAPLVQARRKMAR
jgi:hypothetical protein